MQYANLFIAVKIKRLHFLHGDIIGREKSNFLMIAFHYFVSEEFSFLVFKDKKTSTPFIEEFPEDDGEAAKASKPDHIYMDAMGFGMGCCCLQV